MSTATLSRPLLGARKEPSSLPPLGAFSSPAPAPRSAVHREGATGGFLAMDLSLDTPPRSLQHKDFPGTVTRPFPLGQRCQASKVPSAGTATCPGVLFP